MEIAPISLVEKNPSRHLDINTSRLIVITQVELNRIKA